jgi:hypothetical protein
MDAQFIAATRGQIRFDSSKGQLTVEQLWDLPLTSTVGHPNLNDIAKALHRVLKNSDDEISFVTPVQKADTSNQLKFDIVKDIIAIKIAERDERTAAEAKRVQKNRIMELLAKKEDDSLAEKSTDELKALLAAM